MKIATRRVVKIAVEGLELWGFAVPVIDEASPMEGICWICRSAKYILVD
jgi:hypothetical protein